jgi:transposase-like protein
MITVVVLGKRSQDWIPRVISTDKNPAYGEAIAALKKDGTIPPHVEHRLSGPNLRLAL